MGKEGQSATLERPIIDPPNDALGETLRFLNKRRKGFVHHPSAYDSARLMAEIAERYKTNFLVVAANPDSAKHIREVIAVASRNGKGVSSFLSIITMGSLSPLLRASLIKPNKQQDMLFGTPLIFIDKVDCLSPTTMTGLLNCFSDKAKIIGFTSTDSPNNAEWLAASLGSRICDVTFEEAEKQQAQIAELREARGQVREPLEVGEHAHHYIVDADEGPQSHAYCKHCHEEKDFRNSLELDFNRAKPRRRTRP
ncbi:MAG: hypothetical protein HYU48_00555 [Candidatus Levybacteria bacterium]|nr:hypothetical protein [Candidatus Levybacteria bacterium]